MPVIYENWGHRKRCIEDYHRLVFKIREFKKSNLCRSCKREMTFRSEGKNGWQRQVSVDHVISRGNGGSDTEENFALICRKCNNKKARTEQIKQV